MTIEDVDHDIVKVRGIGQAPSWVDRGRTVRMTFAERATATAVRGRILEVQYDRVRIVVAGTVSNVQRRAANRVSVVEPVAVVVYQPGGQGQVITMRLRDLSKGGCRLQAPCPIPGGLRVRVKLMLGGAPVQIPGHVVQGRASEQVGVEFDRLPADVDGALTRFLFERQPRGV